MDFSPKTLRKRWGELQALFDPLEAERNKLGAELDSIVDGTADLSLKAAREREAEIRPRIKELQDQMYPVEMERAAVARALGRRGLVDVLAGEEATEE